MQTALSLSNILFFHSSLGHNHLEAFLLLLGAFYFFCSFCGTSLYTWQLELPAYRLQIHFLKICMTAAFPSVLQALWGGFFKGSVDADLTRGAPKAALSGLFCVFFHLHTHCLLQVVCHQMDP